MNMQPTVEPFEWPIIAYMILAGTSAGAAMTGAIAFLSGRAALRSIARQGFLIAMVLIGVGFPLLILDLEQPQKFFYILYYFNPNSVIAWGARGISLYFAILLVTVFVQYLRAKRALNNGASTESPGRGLKVTAATLLLLSFFVALYPGFVLNQAVAHPLWSQSLLPVLFLASGLHMGLVTVTLARLWSAGAPDFEPEPDDPLLHDHKSIRWIDGAFIVVQAVLFCLFLAWGWQLAPEAVRSFNEGAYAFVLWGGVVTIGWIVPTIDMLVRKANSNLWLRGLCVLIGGVCLRILIIRGGQGAAAFIGAGN